MEDKNIVHKVCGACGKEFTYDKRVNRWRNVCDACRVEHAKEQTAYRKDTTIIADSGNERHRKPDLSKCVALAKFNETSYGEIVAQYDYDERAELFKMLQLAKTLRGKKKRRTRGYWHDPEQGEGDSLWQPEEPTLIPLKKT